MVLQISDLPSHSNDVEAGSIHGIPIAGRTPVLVCYKCVFRSQLLSKFLLDEGQIIPRSGGICGPASDRIDALKNPHFGPQALDRHDSHKKWPSIVVREASPKPPPQMHKIQKLTHMVSHPNMPHAHATCTCHPNHAEHATNTTHATYTHMLTCQFMSQLDMTTCQAWTKGRKEILLHIHHRPEPPPIDA